MIPRSSSAGIAERSDICSAASRTSRMIPSIAPWI
jgi:hypothetical protein